MHQYSYLFDKFLQTTITVLYQGPQAYGACIVYNNKHSENTYPLSKKLVILLCARPAMMVSVIVSGQPGPRVVQSQYMHAHRPATVGVTQACKVTSMIRGTNASGHEVYGLNNGYITSGRSPLGKKVEANWQVNSWQADQQRASL